MNICKNIELNQEEIQNILTEKLRSDYDDFMKQVIRSVARKRNIVLTNEMLNEAYEGCFERVVSCFKDVLENTIENCTTEYFNEDHIHYSIKNNEIASLKDKECDEWGLAEAWDLFRPENGVELNISYDYSTGVKTDCTAIYKSKIIDGVKETDYSTFMPYEVDVSDPNWRFKLLGALRRAYKLFY